MVKVLYFARLREALGSPGEEIDVPAGISTVSGLMQYLAARGEPWQQEFDGCRPLRAALNQTLVPNDTQIKAGDEVAFFPPVTGG
ncbi:MAG TPA: molybdopterin converting factor subunit 1 [Methylophilaceae bacterium]|nr:molybdopterin converting factor subunit 1 [Methylophilaceae bacterium]